LNLAKATSPAEVRNLRDEIFLAEQSRWTGPVGDYKQSPTPIPLDAIRNSLSADELVLLYVLSQPRAYCFVISHSGSRIVPLEDSEKIQNAVSAYLTTIRSKGADMNPPPHLHQMLFGPVADVSSPPRLIIVRDGPLHLLPFDALVDSGQQYVAQTHNAAYAPSASAWYSLKTMHSQRASERLLIAVGGVPYDEN